MADDATRRSGMSRAEQKAATRARLVTAAGELFAERDYGDVTIADLAAHAGVAHGLLFHHFSNKEGLYRAVLDAVVAEMDSAFTAPADGDAPSIIRAALTTHLSYLATHRGVALKLIVGRRHADPTAAEVSDRSRGRALSALAALVDVDTDNPVIQFVGATLVAAFDEATHWWLHHPAPFPVDALVTSLLELAIGALEGARSLDGCPDVDAAIATLRIAALGSGPDT
ncbi:TetR/AcrR family transcriptional regulator [Williamsia herbipolensis]|uniref:TetR/AcrR family transcriptional regulator n=1 Tax=Williamsia herbipolensis TaxID=1603258 RepID=A0AAU4JZ39_9NOCA|nr:TetR/AcrR family transcriptional regulator [Williamsia herbipolensis]